MTSCACDRRTLLAAAGAVGLLTACGGGGGSTTSSPSSADDPVITDLETLRAEGAIAFEGESGKAVVVAVGDEVVAFSSTCTHQGCTVEWNPESKTLDCPCHGSSYDPADGAKVLGGPAPAPLAPVEVVVEGNEVRRA